MVEQEIKYWQFARIWYDEETQNSFCVEDNVYLDEMRGKFLWVEMQPPRLVLWEGNYIPKALNTNIYTWGDEGFQISSDVVELYGFFRDDMQNKKYFYDIWIQGIDDFPENWKKDV